MATSAEINSILNVLRTYRVYPDANDRHKLSNHDLDNPLQHSYFSAHENRHDPSYNLSGNCLSVHASQTWIAKDGSIIRSGIFNRDENEKYRVELAEQLTAQGLDVLPPCDSGISQDLKRALEPNEIVIRHADFESEIHALLFVKRARTLSGREVNVTRRIDSIGRDTIIPAYLNYLKRMEDHYPSTQEEAEVKAIEAAERYIAEKYASHCMEPDIIERQYEPGLNTYDHSPRVKYIMQHTTTLLQKTKEDILVSFSGRDPEDPWKPYANKIDYILQNESARRHYAKKNGGGLHITSLALTLSKSDGIDKTKPLIKTDYKGMAKSQFIYRPMGLSGDATLTANKGRIEATYVSDEIKITTGRVTIKNKQFPETALAGLAGRRLQEVIDHPFITDDMIVTSIIQNDNNLICRIRMESYPYEFIPTHEG